MTSVWACRRYASGMVSEVLLHAPWWRIALPFMPKCDIKVGIVALQLCHRKAKASSSIKGTRDPFFRSASIICFSKITSAPIVEGSGIKDSRLRLAQWKKLCSFHPDPWDLMRRLMKIGNHSSWVSLTPRWLQVHGRGPVFVFGAKALRLQIVQKVYIEVRSRGTRRCCGGIIVCHLFASEVLRSLALKSKRHFEILQSVQKPLRGSEACSGINQVLYVFEEELTTQDMGLNTLPPILSPEELTVVQHEVGIANSCTGVPGFSKRSEFWLLDDAFRTGHQLNQIHLYLRNHQVLEDGLTLVKEGLKEILLLLMSPFRMSSLKSWSLWSLRILWLNSWRSRFLLETLQDWLKLLQLNWGFNFCSSYLSSSRWRRGYAGSVVFYTCRGRFDSPLLEIQLQDLLSYLRRRRFFNLLLRGYFLGRRWCSLTKVRVKNSPSQVRLHRLIHPKRFRALLPTVDEADQLACTHTWSEHMGYLKSCGPSSECHHTLRLPQPGPLEWVRGLTRGLPFLGRIRWCIFFLWCAWPLCKLQSRRNLWGRIWFSSPGWIEGVLEPKWHRVALA